MRGHQDANMHAVLPRACNRCNHQFPNLDKVSLDVAKYIFAQHDQVCIGPNGCGQVAPQLAASGVGIAHAQFTTTSPPPLGENENAAAVTAPLKQEREKYMTDPMARKAKLEADEWGRDVTPTSIICNGCNKKILLDQRGEYYPGLWIKHRKKCKMIAKKSGIKNPPSAAGRTSARKSVVRSFSPDNGGATSMMRVANSTPNWQVDIGSSPCGRSASPSTISSRSSSVGPSRTLPSISVHKRYSEPIYSLRPRTIAPPKELEFDYVAGPPETSISITPFEDAHDTDNTYDEVSTSDGGSEPRSSSSIEGSHRGARVGSGRYWSEAPFDGGLGESSTGLYRFSTRWELVKVFPGMHKKRYEKDGFDEEMA